MITVLERERRKQKKFSSFFFLGKNGDGKVLIRRLPESTTSGWAVSPKKKKY